MTLVWIAILVSYLLISILFILVLNLLSQYANTLRNMSAPGVISSGLPLEGDNLGEIIVQLASGTEKDLTSLCNERGGLILIFLSEHCSACDDVIGRLLVTPIEPSPRTRLLLVSPKAGTHALDAISAVGVESVVWDEKETLASRIGVAAFPTAIELDERGHMIRQPATGSHAVRELVSCSDCIA